MEIKTKQFPIQGIPEESLTCEAPVILSPEAQNALLQYMLSANIDVESILRAQEEKENMKLLEKYPYKIFKSGDRWYCRLPDGRRMTRVKKEDLEAEIIKIQKNRDPM